ncbi:hypothetical protein BDQ94DRAFT_154636 [Aspergillus welwitschiae]|uniref:Fe2OG dioxygenase domain-containing protein n=1 Tax=Aspergillus welwitschiae TaxID=1341132 RepID=A0A3F3PJG0_9EURO|nr:hypothetical protein BDQ94DRAFT_154636 [Aspergillus welwitschiae]RDH27084.1 hypothetical protein BDQ94DRAFT_154636 [Aspergillus welwitschiae]
MQPVSLSQAIDFARLCQGLEVLSLNTLVKQYGAFKITNHGISSRARNGCFAYSKSAFERPNNLKSADPAFSPLKGETVRGTAIPKESLNIAKDKLGNYPPVQTLHKELKDFTPRLLEGLSQTLRLEPSLNSLCTNGEVEIALHHYPNITAVPERNPEHRDWSLLTLLLHEDTGISNGLEVAELPGRKFTPVDPGNGEITVLVGSMLRRLAKYYCWEDIPSCVHRVSGTGERYSIAYFLHINDSTRLAEDGTTAGDIRRMWETQSKVKN